MKIRLALLAFTLAITAATATQSRAQVVWSAPASGCVAESLGETLASINPVYGTVSFAAGKHGDIHMTCPISFLSSAYGQTSPSGLVLTFYDYLGSVGGVNHCFIDAALLRSNLQVEQGWTITDFSTIDADSEYAGRQVVAGYIPETFNFQSNYYWVDVWLHRDASNAACNPTFVGAFLE